MWIFMVKKASTLDQHSSFDTIHKNWNQTRSFTVGIQYDMVTDTAKVSFLMATDRLGLSFHPTHSFAMPVV